MGLANFVKCSAILFYSHMPTRQDHAANFIDAGFTPPCELRTTREPVGLLWPRARSWMISARRRLPAAILKPVFLEGESPQAGHRDRAT